MKRLRKQIYDILEVSQDKKGVSWVFDILLTAVIALNVLAIVLQSVKPINEKYHLYFDVFENFSVLLFSVEYLLRIWVAVENSSFRHPVTGRIRFIFTPLAIIDLLAILPSILTLFTIDMRFVRVLRLFRLIRLFKVLRYSNALTAIGSVVRERKEQLVISLSFVMIMLLLVSTFMYHIEHEVQPDAFGSIPETMWWGVATLTTVGYGDVYPVTPLGKLLGGLICVLGIGLFALPTGILASGFAEVMNKPKKDSAKCCTCPNCGHEMEVDQS